VLKHFQTFQLHLSKETFKKNPNLEKLLKTQSKSEFVYKISPTTELPSQKQLPDTSVKKEQLFIQISSYLFPTDILVRVCIKFIIPVSVQPEP
jgi:hypothetical protein